MHPTMAWAFADEMEKIALTRWQAALQSGEISPEDAAVRMGPSAGLTQVPALGPVYTKHTRQRLWEGGGLNGT